MIGVYENLRIIFIWLLVSLNRHKNIIPHCMHIRVTYEMVLKTRFRANISYRTHPNGQNMHDSIFVNVSIYDKDTR